MKIKVSFFFLVMVASLLLSHSYISLAAFAAATLHELGHIIAARICDVPLKEMKLGIFGAAITPDSNLCSYKKEIFLALSGPLINMISVLLCWRSVDSANSFVSMFVVSSLFLGTLNLLPIDDFDGGRILKCCLLLKLPPDKVTKICDGISFLLIFFLWIFSVYLLLRLSASLSLFTFSISLFCKTFISRKI